MFLLQYLAVSKPFLFVISRKGKEKKRKKETSTGGDHSFPSPKGTLHLSLTLQHVHCSLWHENLIKLRRNRKTPLQYFHAEPESTLQTPTR